MASPAELAQTLPETLPEDFGDWDNGDSKDTAPGFGDAQKPSPQPDAPHATVGLQADKPNEAPPPSPTAVDPDDGALPHQQNSISTAADRLPSSPSRRQGAAHTTSEVSSPPVRQKFDVKHGSRNKPEFEATAIRGDDQSLVRPLR